MKIAIIGASNNPNKFGNKILKDLLDKGHIIFPINPKEKEIEGILCYSNLDLFIKSNNDFSIVNFVVKPEITLSILKNNLDFLKTKKIWCQPGSSNDEVKLFLETNGFKDYIIDSCIMIENIKRLMY